MGKRELLFSVTKKDLVVETFPAGKAGGQHANKTATAVRIRHPASGAVGESREHKSQYQNKATALRRLADHHKFKVWQSLRVYEITQGEAIERTVERSMAPENLKVEVKDERGRWVQESPAPSS